MTPEEFRQHAHELVDWMADYLTDVGSRPVTPRGAPGEIRAALPASPPAEGEPFERIFADFREHIVPGMSHWQHPGWFAYFPANSSPPSVLAEMLTATLAAQCMSWQTSPAATELEQVTLDWLRQLLGLPEAFTGVIQDTASTATLVALICARERATGDAAGQHGLAGMTPRVVYCSQEAHASVDKGVKLAGYGLDHLRRVATCADRTLDPGALAAAIVRDRDAGLEPACVVATVGTTSTGAVDPLPAIGALCQEHGLWLHVDAAWAGSAAVCPEHRDMLAGVELADSFLFNPHKWLLTNFDCTAYYVRDVDALERACATTPAYLRTAHDPEVVNYRDRQLQLGRRFRALKLWFVLRSYGTRGLQAHIREHVRLAALFADWVAASPDFELLAPVSLGLVCFRQRPEDLDPTDPSLDDRNRQLLDRVNASGEVFLTHTELDGRVALRLSVGTRATEEQHVRRAWQLLTQPKLHP